MVEEAPRTYTNAQIKALTPQEAASLSPDVLRGLPSKQRAIIFQKTHHRTSTQQQLGGGETKLRKDMDRTGKLSRYSSYGQGAAGIRNTTTPRPPK